MLVRAALESKSSDNGKLTCAKLGERTSPAPCNKTLSLFTHGASSSTCHSLSVFTSFSRFYPPPSFIFPVFFISPCHFLPNPDLRSSSHLFLLLSLLSLSPLCPCQSLSPTSAPTLCRNSTLSHNERLTLLSCFPVLLHCCHGETLCVYMCVCVCARVCEQLHRLTLV